MAEGIQSGGPGDGYAMGRCVRCCTNIIVLGTRDTPDIPSVSRIKYRVQSIPKPTISTKTAEQSRS